jgi:hypothetical protein
MEYEVISGLQNSHGNEGEQLAAGEAGLRPYVFPESMAGRRLTQPVLPKKVVHRRLFFLVRREN